MFFSPLVSGNRNESSYEEDCFAKTSTFRVVKRDSNWTME